MGRGSTQVSLPQNMYDWIGRAIGKLAQIIRWHPLDQIVKSAPKALTLDTNLSFCYKYINKKHLRKGS